MPNCAGMELLILRKPAAQTPSDASAMPRKLARSEDTPLRAHSGLPLLSNLAIKGWVK